MGGVHIARINNYVIMKIVIYVLKNHLLLMIKQNIGAIKILLNQAYESSNLRMIIIARVRSRGALN